MKATLNYTDRTTKVFYLVSPKGDKGDTGLTGPIGPIGPRGPVGAGLVIKGTVKEASQLPKSGNQDGYCYFIGTDLYVWDAGAWKNCGSVSPDLSKYVTITDLNNGLSNKVTDNKNGSIQVNGSSITPADDSKVVHNSGTEEIAGQKKFDIAPIDKTTGNPYITKDGVPNVDLSGYVLDNKDNTIKANNVNYDLSKTGLKSLDLVSSGSFNDLPLGTVLADGSSVTDGPGSSAFITTTFYSSQFGGYKAQIAINTFTDSMYFRTWSSFWYGWMLVPNDSNLVHNSGDEEINGQKTFNKTPIDQRTDNPYITKSDIPSDLARTGSSQEFTGKNTFDTAPIDQTTGHPYITKDGVPTYIEASKNDESSAISDSQASNSGNIYYWTEG